MNKKVLKRKIKFIKDPIENYLKKEIIEETISTLNFIKN
ncbi:hypothetical protein BL14DL4_02060 [Bacillus licheniformis]|nr:hypothetical protein BL14DL4_02060 [Bacillus licheniformis]